MIQPATYMMANKRNGTLYVGVTSDLPKCTYEHRTHAYEGFSARYDCTALVWYALHETMESAILHEKQIKSGSRKKKLVLIEVMNPDWNDLYEQL